MLKRCYRTDGQLLLILKAFKLESGLPQLVQASWPCWRRDRLYRQRIQLSAIVSG